MKAHTTLALSSRYLRKDSDERSVVPTITTSLVQASVAFVILFLLLGFILLTSSNSFSSAQEQYLYCMAGALSLMAFVGIWALFALALPVKVIRKTHPKMQLFAVAALSLSFLVVGFILFQDNFRENFGRAMERTDVKVFSWANMLGIYCMGIVVVFIYQLVRNRR